MSKYFVLLSRVVKVSRNNANNDKFASRSNNVQMHGISGPYSELKLAEKASVLSLKTFGVIDSRVWSLDEIKTELERGGNTSFDYRIEKELRAFIRRQQS